MRIWASRWKVTFEPSKCKVLTISRKRIPTRPELQFCSIPLALMNELEILGVTIDSKLTRTKHVSNTAWRAGKKLGALRRVAIKLDRRGRAIVYKAQVRNVMEYTSLSWMSASPTTLRLLDSMQKKALRVIYCHLFEALASALQSYFCCEPLIRPWGYLSQCTVCIFSGCR